MITAVGASSRCSYSRFLFTARALFSEIGAATVRYSCKEVNWAVQVILPYLAALTPGH
jgi:hypothetical protein